MSRAKQIFSAGDTPGKGAYICKRCGKCVGIDDETVALPLCPQCQGTDFVKMHCT
jgi:DNA-directed RNA polymerase subunit RPC12/RpoP